MLKKIGGILFLILGIMLIGVQPQVILAQSEGDIREQTTNEDQIVQLNITYRQQMEAYRNQEKKYLVAVEQYEQLQTLAALEEIVQTAKQLIIIRDRTIITHLGIVRLTITDVHGIPVDDKAEVIAKLQVLETQVKSHETDSEQITDRFTLASNAEAFALMSSDLNSSVYHALSLVLFGRLQNVYDKTNALLPELETNMAINATDFELAKKQRALQELKILSANTKTELDKIYD